MKTVDADTVERLLESGRARIINVLPESSFKKVHVAGSENVARW